MIKFLHLDFLVVSHRILWKNENTVHRLQLPALVPEIFKFEKCVKYANDMTDDVIHSTHYYIKYINRAILAIFQANSSAEVSPTAIKHFVPMATHSFPVPTHLISICKCFSARKTLNKATNWSLQIYMPVGSCIRGAIWKYENGTPKLARNASNKVWNTKAGQKCRIGVSGKSLPFVWRLRSLSKIFTRSLTESFPTRKHSKVFVVVFV